ncbi:helix-turn-helix domain-containing protein [Paenibacillus alkalitolerans]|uniref:helix-turn-helix domain-containing protein n=1 Tax=Paenibacillus alkalitolerans TaxID=2799335 RepID=UPI0018F3821E|nr:helix-turn-helix domain-containing protein [Paenibacillus alkalitolerans]
MFKGNRQLVWFNKLLRRKFFLKLIMTTTLIAVIPNLLSDVVAYYKFSQTFEEETGKSKLQYLNQTLNAIEIVLKRIEENSNLLVLNQSFLSFERFPNGKYYEALKGELLKEDLSALYEYLKAKTNSIRTINSFRLSNEYVDSVYYYDSRKDLVLTSENDGSNRQFSLDSFHDKDWYPTLGASRTNSVFMDPRIANQYNDTKKNLLTIIYKTRYDNAIVINLDASIIYNEIINILNNRDDMYVVSAKGKVLFHSDRENMHRSIHSILPKSAGLVGKNGSFVAKIGNKQILVSHSVSPFLGWTFVNVSDMEALSKGTASIKQTILLSATVLIFLSFTLAYLSSRSLYRPISRLKAIVGSDSERKSPEQTDEIGIIGRFMQSALNERDYYKEKLEQSLPVHREQFKSSLLHRHSMSVEEIESNIAYLGINIDLNDLVVLALSLDDDTGRETIEHVTFDLVKLRMIDTLERSPILNAKHFFVRAEKNIVAVVMSCGGMDRQQVFLLGQQLLDEVNYELRHPCTVGIGRICDSILELPQSYEEALIAIKYRILYGSGMVIAIDDIRIDNESRFVYPLHKEELLLGHLKTARTKEALQAFDEFVSEIDAHKNKLHYNQIQPMFMQLLTGMIHACSQLGADIRTVSGGATDPYRELLDRDSLDQIGRWFHRLIQMTTLHIEREMNAKGNQHISRVIDILERDYNREISLNSVAEQLSMNPAYISRLFKQITGQTFVDYVKRIRIEKSKVLLAGSTLKINEVGKQVGYDNAYYFIKVFKEMIGVTPGEYKKLYGS